MTITPLVLLHLSDLHFGWTGEPAAEAKRDAARTGLKTALLDLPGDWRPNVICVSGDIGWAGKPGDYSEAKEWLSDLLSSLGLDAAGSLVLCPGNHDVDRGVARKISRPPNASEADTVLDLPLAQHLKKVFANYEAFCEALSVPAYDLGGEKSFLAGARGLKGTRFVAVNSCWFSKNESDQNNLWIGLPQLERMAHSKQLQVPSDERPLTIALMHHPPPWLADPEQNAQTNPARVNATSFLAEHCDVLLTGHTHAEPRAPDRIVERALHFNGGASWAGANFPNWVRLLRFGGPRVEHVTLEFDPRSSERSWIPRPAVSSALRVSSTPHVAERLSDTRALREAAQLAAKALIARKANTLGATGIETKTIDLTVFGNRSPAQAAA